MCIRESILDLGANIEAQVSIVWRPLHFAARYGQPEAVKALLDNGANPTAKTRKFMGYKPSGVEFNPSVSYKQQQAIRKLLKEAEKKWKEAGKG